MLCQGCPSRSVCQSSCPELVLHLKETEGSQKELPVSNPRYGKIPWSSSIPLTPREKEIVPLLGKGLTRRDVCQLLDITRGNLKKIIQRMKKKV